MRWVEKISWDGSSYRVNTVSNLGQREVLPVSALHDFGFNPKGVRRSRVITDFQTWREVPDKTYLTGIGFPDDTASGQCVYEFEAEGKVFQVPATVLMKGLFRPLRGLAPHLFRPQGLDSLMIGSPNEGSDAVGFFVSPEKKLGFNPSRSAGTLAALSWMVSFPSATLMWDSLIQNARNGKLAIGLPVGKVTLIVRAALRYKWLVTDITVVTLDTPEAPYDFAAGHSRNIAFHLSARFNGVCKEILPKKLEYIPRRGNDLHLSNKEWARLEAIVTNGEMRRHSLRKIIDCILVKFGEGIPWRSVRYGKLNRPSVVRRYQLMQRDGRWDALIRLLQEMRVSDKQNNPKIPI